MIWFRRIFLSWDILAALVLALLGMLIYGPTIDTQFAKDMYNMGVSVLAIVFSVYFAALAIIISSGDNEFIDYLESRGHYTALIAAFKISLGLLFAALVYSLIAFTWTSHQVSQNHKEQNIFILTGFIFLFAYSIFATVASSLDTIRYSEMRIMFLQTKKKRLPEATPPPVTRNKPNPMSKNDDKKAS